MNKTALIIFIVLILIVGIILIISYALPNTATSPTDQYLTPAAANPDVAATIIYTDSGFSPSDITIRPGQSVTWINNSSDRMLVASDPHPAHTNLPGFDQGVIANPGSSWTYTFAVTGIHTYHDHIHPDMKGSVKVE